MSQDNYFIPLNYQSNPAISYDKSSENEYWNEARQFASKSYQKAVYEWANKIINQHKYNKIADIGCGYAEKLKYIHENNKNIEIYGIDQPNIIAICQKVHQFGHWLATNFENPEDIVSHKFDLIISSDVIEHLENPDALLDFIKKIATENSLILISTPERDKARGKSCLYSPNKQHVREWNREEFAQYISSRGFEIIEHKILPALSFSFSQLYFRHLLGRIQKGKGINYNQAMLIRIRK